MTSSQKSKPKGLNRLLLACRYSWQGLRSALSHEAAFRQESLLLLVGVPAAIWVSASLWQAVMLIAALLLILIVELLNSAIEALADRVSTQRHELSGRAKDMGSAAVLLSIILAVILWVSAFWENRPF